MSLSRRQQRLLKTIDDAVSRSDPYLASMLALFGQLTRGEKMPGGEQLRAPAPRRLWITVLTVSAASAVLIFRVAAAGVRIIRFGVAASTAVAGRLVRDRHPAGHVPDRERGGGIRGT